jgi:hypothetical protein
VKTKPFLRIGYETDGRKSQHNFLKSQHIGKKHDPTRPVSEHGAKTKYGIS